MTQDNVQVRLAARPHGRPKATDFQITTEPIPKADEGQVVIRNLYLSLDPAMRGWMDDRKSYVPPIGIGEVMRGLTVGTVVESRDPRFAVGDRVSGVLGWQSFACTDGKHLTPIPPGVSPTLALGPLGMTGLTAYFGLLDVGKPEAGNNVLVSGAAGAVGSVVGQLAKIKKCRVAGTAGSDDKCSWITDDLGFDAAINYKKQDLSSAIKAALPGGIDIYFDNVGGATLDTALRFINRGARVVICGAISQYNATEPQPGPSNYLSLLINRARMEGFIVFDYQARYGEAIEHITRWISEGRLHSRTDIVDGLHNAPQALLRLFDGANTGKLLVRIADE